MVSVFHDSARGRRGGATDGRTTNGGVTLDHTSRTQAVGKERRLYIAPGGKRSNGVILEMTYMIYVLYLNNK